MPMPLLLLLLLRRRASAVFWVRFGFETFVEIGMRSERRERRKGRGERRQGRIGASLIRKSSGSQFFLYPRFYLARDALGLERLQDGAGGHLGGSERERSSKTGSGGRGDERTREKRRVSFRFFVEGHTWAKKMTSSCARPHRQLSLTRTKNLNERCCHHHSTRLLFLFPPPPPAIPRPVSSSRRSSTRSLQRCV